MRYLAATLLSALMAAVSAGGASAEPTWKLEQPPPPPGASFAVPLGKPGDLQFLAPNHGLLAVSGNATVPAGLYFYDGAGWHQLSTVCGGPGRTTRIAIASPREFWTITLPEQAARADGGHRAVPLPRRPGGRVLQHAAAVARPVPGGDGRRLHGPVELLVRRSRRRGRDRRAARRVPPALGRRRAAHRLRTAGTRRVRPRGARRGHDLRDGADRQVAGRPQRPARPLRARAACRA